MLRALCSCAFSHRLAPKADIRVGARQSLALQSPIGWALDIHWREALQNAYRCRTMRAIEAGLLSVEPEAH